jgi:hypothetical protein
MPDAASVCVEVRTASPNLLAYEAYGESLMPESRPSQEEFEGRYPLWTVTRRLTGGVRKSEAKKNSQTSLLGCVVLKRAM